jgi:hypothetical protein
MVILAAISKDKVREIKFCLEFFKDFILSNNVLIKSKKSRKINNIYLGSQPGGLERYQSSGHLGIFESVVTEKLKGWDFKTSRRPNWKKYYSNYDCYKNTSKLISDCMTT